MVRSSSIADARNQLAQLVHQVEQGRQIQLTRHGTPVAMLVSIADYRRWMGEHHGFWEACDRFRSAHHLSQLELEPAVLEGLRDRTPGREVVM